MKLSLLAILLGVGMGLPQIYGLLKPAGLAAVARKFPRNLRAGVVLMLLATVWFAWNVNVEPIADFSAFKPYMLGAFIAVGILSCIFVQDFLAVRGLAVLMLLLAKTMLDTGRPYLPTTIFHAQQGESSWVLVIQTWAYVFVVLGIWFTITPWRLRDLINWATASEGRTRLLSLIRLGFAACILTLGLTVFRAM
ncbi:MAG TPA: hypothetical protein VF480_01275 [Verrucomicrobiae bacterium]